MPDMVHAGFVNTMQVCESGHIITDLAATKPERKKHRCPQCGARTVIQCKECAVPIPGWVHPGGIVVRKIPHEPPAYCHNCGEPFPWTQTATSDAETAGGSSKPPDAFARLDRILQRFPNVARQLKIRHSGRDTLAIADEYDVQDLLHALLLIDFDDVRTEEWTPSYAGGASRMDFLLKEEQIVVEVKKTRETLTDKAVGTELLVDIARYKAHSDCQSLVCFVYDPEHRIKNPTGLKADLEKGSSSDLQVVVYIIPT